MLSKLYDKVYANLPKCRTYCNVLQDALRDQYCAISGQFSYVRRRELDTCIGYLENLSPGLQDLPVLDVGCGAGGFTRQFASIAPYAIGVDISPAAIRLASQAAHNLHADNAHFLVASFENMPFASNSFSTVIAFDSIQHARPYSVVAREVHRIVAPGGWFIFTNWLPKGNRFEITNRDPLYHELNTAGFSVIDLQDTDPGLLDQVKIYIGAHQRRGEIEREGGALLIEMLMADAKHIWEKRAQIQRGLTVAMKL